MHLKQKLYAWARAFDVINTNLAVEFRKRRAVKVRVQLLNADIVIRLHAFFTTQQWCIVIACTQQSKTQDSTGENDMLTRRGAWVRDSPRAIKPCS